ncbi:hypothetical protein J2Y63_002425 [Shinella sp. BE166]|uniref:hypothetical protein n=1 Tax=Shinella sp. BE166 TaxID=3373918 RepID=UPI003EBF2C0E
MTKGEIIPFQSGDETGRFRVTNGELPVSCPAAASSGGFENFDHLGEAIMPVILRLQGRLPRVRVRATEKGVKPPPS